MKSTIDKNGRQNSDKRGSKVFVRYCEFILPRKLPGSFLPWCVFFAVLLLQASIAPSIAKEALQLSPERHPVGKEAPGAFVPYAANQSPLVRNDEITRLIFSIHSSGFDAMRYLKHAESAVAKSGTPPEETLIIAPHFLEQKAMEFDVPEGLLFWLTSPFRGSSKAAVGPSFKEAEISAYEVLDDWLEKLTDGSLFPSLKEVILVGHSAGGQLVQRYALVGKFEPPQGIECRYVVSAPSSYAYPGPERWDAEAKKFKVPDRKSRASCPDYNDWGYGLEKPYKYFAEVDSSKIVDRYARRSVFYLCGADDLSADDETLSTSAPAMLQGPNRLARMHTFSAYLKEHYGSALEQRHKFAVVPAAGHDGLATMTSNEGLNFLFSPDP